MTARARYAEVGEALRLAIDRAIALDLPASGWRVVAAVVSLVASYSRLSDRVYVSQIASRASLSERRTREWLKRLDAAGVLSVDLRRGGSGDRPRSVVGLPTGHLERPLDEDLNRTVQRPQADTRAPSTGQPERPNTEKTSEKNSEEDFPDWISELGISEERVA